MLIRSDTCDNCSAIFHALKFIYRFSFYYILVISIHRSDDVIYKLAYDIFRLAWRRFPFFNMNIVKLHFQLNFVKYDLYNVSDLLTKFF